MGWILAVIVASLGTHAVAKRVVSNVPDWSFRDGASSLFFLIAFASSYLFFRKSRPPIVLSRTVLFGATAITLVALAGPSTSDAMAPLFTSLGSLGVLSTLGLAWHCTVGTSLTQGHARSLLLPAFMLPLFVLSSDFFLRWSVSLHPDTLDPLVHMADASLGTLPSFQVGQWFAAIPPLRILSLVVYAALPAAVAAVYLACEAQTSPAATILDAFFWTGLIGYALYNLFPVVGPAIVFDADFPNASPSPTALGVAPMACSKPFPRNCMPSLHTAWALLIAWHARPLKPWFRHGAIAWLFFTEAATLGTGAHYLFDLVVAFPFTLAIDAALRTSANRPLRYAVVGGASLVTAAWLLTLRFAATSLLGHSVRNGLLATVTIVVSWLAQAHVAKSAPAANATISTS